MRRVFDHPAEGPSFEEAARTRPAVAAARPPELEELERLVGFATEAAGDVHRRLRPVLRALAGHRLRTRRGIDLDTDPRAADLLGPDLYELVRPDRPAPADLRAPGLSAEHQAALVAILEDL